MNATTLHYADHSTQQRSREILHSIKPVSTPSASAERRWPVEQLLHSLPIWKSDKPAFRLNLNRQKRNNFIRWLSLSKAYWTPVMILSLAVAVAWFQASVYTEKSPVLSSTPAMTWPAISLERTVYQWVGFYRTAPGALIHHE